MHKLAARTKMHNSKLHLCGRQHLMCPTHAPTACAHQEEVGEEV